MSEYTAEDFKNAELAIRGTVGAARRAEPDTTLPWIYGDNEWDDDKGMVENGWRPVHEHNPHATDDLEEGIQDLRDRLNAMVEENICRRSESAPLTLDTLREAWENAEVPPDDTPIQRGDLVIWKDIMGYRISEALDGTVVEFLNERVVRVLKRAPRREPWQALADVLADMGHLSPTGHAKDLHARGVRLVGGDDDE